MPNFTGVSAMPFFRIGFSALKARDRLAPRAIVGRCLQLVDHLGDDAVRHLHVVGRDAAALGRIEIRPPHVERIAAEREGDLVDHALDAGHALRPAEAAEGGVRHGVRLHPPRADVRVVQRIGIVGMEHRAVGDGAGKVGGIAAARRLVEAHAADHAVRRRSPRRSRCGNRGACRSSPCRRRGRAGALPAGRSSPRRARRSPAISAGWLSLPPKPPPIRRTSTVTALSDRPSTLATVCCTSARMLRGGMDEHVAALARNGVGDLAFEIEMVLPADHAACRDRRCGARGERGVRVAEPHLVRRQLGGRRRRRARPRRVISAGRSSYSTRASFAAARAALDRLRRHGEERLAGILDHVLGEDRIVVEDRARIVLAGNVGGGQHADDARRRPHAPKRRATRSAHAPARSSRRRSAACRAAPGCRRHRPPRRRHAARRCHARSRVRTPPLIASSRRGWLVRHRGDRARRRRGPG